MHNPFFHVVCRVGANISKGLIAYATAPFYLKAAIAAFASTA